MIEEYFLFLCDQTRCEKCSGKIMPDIGCKHTSDITYAKNKTKVMRFEKIMGFYFEVEE